MSCKLQLRKPNLCRDYKTTHVYSCIQTLKALLTSDMQVQLNVSDNLADFVNTRLDANLVVVAGNRPGEKSLVAHENQLVMNLAEATVSKPTLQHISLSSRSTAHTPCPRR